MVHNHGSTSNVYNSAPGEQYGSPRAIGAITGSITHLEKSMASLLATIENAEGRLESSGLLRAGPPHTDAKDGGVVLASGDSALSCSIRAQAVRAEAIERRLSALLQRLDV